MTLPLYSTGPMRVRGPGLDARTAYAMAWAVREFSSVCRCGWCADAIKRLTEWALQDYDARRRAGKVTP